MTQPTVPRLYQSVIDEVIESMREAVIDEGLDDQVLTELKQLWEHKLKLSKVLDAPPMPTHLPVPATTSNRTKAVPASSINHTVANQVPAVAQAHVVGANPYQSRPQPVQQAQPLDMSGAAAAATMALPPMYQQQLLAGGIQLQQTSGGITAVIPAAAVQSGNITLQPNQMTNMLQHQKVQLQPQNLSTKDNSRVQGQVDGADDDGADDAGSNEMNSQKPDDIPFLSRCSTAGNDLPPQACRPKTVQPTRRKAKSIQVIIQLDGNDTSSDDDEDIDDDDEDENENEAEEQEEEEEPLNSEDDVSDAEQQDQFETDNVVVCQYDKITRSKNRWRFNLKDGIMNVNQRDYVFQKAHGEAEW